MELDFPGGVDARIFMLEAIRETPETSVNYAFSGPLIDMATLVASRARIYDPIFSIESEEGEHILQAFLKLRPARRGLWRRFAARRTEPSPGQRPATGRLRRLHARPRGAELLFLQFRAPIKFQHGAERHGALRNRRESTDISVRRGHEVLQTPAPGRRPASDDPAADQQPG